MDAFARTGPLMDIRSYPRWLQDVVAECEPARREATAHVLFYLMRDGELSPQSMRNFLVSAWPVIEQFPKYMALNLLKVEYGAVPGHHEARRYLIRNIRVEQSHADFWVDWAQAHDVERDELIEGPRTSAAEALSHWCWHTCHHDTLPAAMAATNYALEGTTGEWANLVCSKTVYENGFSPEVRRPAMRWLKAHSRYDDEHPWEALEIIAMLAGNRPSSETIGAIRTAILRSHEYLRIALDECMAVERTLSEKAALAACH